MLTGVKLFVYAIVLVIAARENVISDTFLTLMARP